MPCHFCLIPVLVLLRRDNHVQVPIRIGHHCRPAQRFARNTHLSQDCILKVL